MLREILKGKHIILASKSPRRQELLKGLDIDFTVLTKDVDESYPDDLPSGQIAAYLAEKKANAFVNELKKNTILITADTIVISNGKVLGKPKDRVAAIQMVSALSGKQHQVTTGVCVKTNDKTIPFSVTTEVEFKTLDQTEIAYYVDQYKPYDKAGSYGIQEWIGYIGIPSIKGSYFNVMGLPVYELYDVLKKNG